ncbi:NAD-dependent epimerase/dehydratase family protein [Paenibacillus thalictri]|uniref:NAD-dependent epimerase/dehydratase family protein n=1 Tax=Paenibacillus thalictri TaxID=2527873 RepID=UPI0030B8D88C
MLVTGGAGFIGSHIVESLLAEGYEPVIVDIMRTGNRTFVPAGVVLYETDISASNLEEVFEKEKPIYAIHLAAQVDVASSLKDPVGDAGTNIVGTIRLLDCCRKFNVKKIVYSSSCAVYGDAEQDGGGITEDFPIRPLTFYGISKFSPELYIRAYQQLYGLAFTIFRYANVYGPRQTPKGEGGVVPIFIGKLSLGDTPVIYGDGEQTRDFVYVKDVAAANLLALRKGDNEIFNIGCSRPTSVNRLYELISSLLEVHVPPLYYPKRSGDITDSLLNHSKAKQQLGWTPGYDLQAGLRETIDYFRAIQQVL